MRGNVGKVFEPMAGSGTRFKNEQQFLKGEVCYESHIVNQAQV